MYLLEEPKKLNGYLDLMEFFSCPGRPVTEHEFLLFWVSLTEEEKCYYVAVTLN